jgi:hypothetical protein
LGFGQLAAGKRRDGSVPQNLYADYTQFLERLPKLFSELATHGGENEMANPKNYRSIEEFEREVLSNQYKVGFSLDDLIEESSFNGSDMLFDDQHDAYDPNQGEDD